jgi:hypothetical protein
MTEYLSYLADVRGGAIVDMQFTLKDVRLFLMVLGRSPVKLAIMIATVPLLVSARHNSGVNVFFRF